MCVNEMYISTLLTKKKKKNVYQHSHRHKFYTLVLEVLCYPTHFCIIRIDTLSTKKVHNLFITNCTNDGS